MLLSIVLAAAITSASQIKTGADLLAACSQEDTRVCEQYIQQLNKDRGSCIPQDGVLLSFLHADSKEGGIADRLAAYFKCSNGGDGD